MNTTKVCNELFKPMLKVTPEWWWILLPAQSLFVHAWQYKFMDVLTTLIELAEQQEDALYFW